MLAEATGPGWEIVAILCSVIVALVGAFTALIISRLNCQSKKLDELRKDMSKDRERMAKLEANVAEVNKKYWENIPEIFNRLRDCEGKGKGG